MSARAELNDVQMAEIRAQAEAEANALFNSGARAGSELSIETLERAYASIEAHLLKAAAMNQASSPVSDAALRRLLQETTAPLDGTTIDESIDVANLAAVDTAPLAYKPTAVQPTSQQGLANTNIRNNTYFEVDSDNPNNPKNGYISTSDPGACAAICLFRNDCFAWSIKRGGGCYLRGKDYTSTSQSGATSGVMTVAAWKPPPTPSPKPLAKGITKYASGLRLSVRFLAAQRSGKLPPNNLVPWRKSAQEEDPVVGGWYEAANELKPNFPMSVAVSYIAWAMVTFPKAFSTADALSNYLGQLRMVNNYLLGCYDEMAKNPSMQWQKKKEGKYSDYFKDVTYTTFPSTDFLDNQAWAAAWLYRATKKKSYLKDAESFWERSYGRNNAKADIFPNWDSLWAPTAALMRQMGRSGVKIPGKDMYNKYFENKFVASWVSANGTNTITKTPKGMAYPAWNIWGNLGYSTTAAMVMLQDAAGNKKPILRKSELAFAKKQVDYALGSTGRSYLVGYGASPPRNVRHGGASCPSRPAVCDMNTLYMRAENGQTLIGALTGGPAGRRRNPANPDLWQDIRTDFATNEPSVTMNGGLAGALAGCFALNP
ncbi:hypothetical protein Ndes2526A_g05046 [Nannochloris sp. 'desiccata']